jgi:uncharacterized membrane protein (UPF0127 family)
MVRVVSRPIEPILVPLNRFSGRGYMTGFAPVLLAGFILLVAACSEPDQDSAAQASAALQTLTIETAAGPVQFTVEFVDTPQSRATGLMFREELPSGTGMLFDFERPREISMWMKNTLIPLDMIFINEDGTIHRIAANAEPLSLNTVASNGQVLGVLEIIGGDAARLGLATGDEVLHPMFGNVPDAG